MNQVDGVDPRRVNSGFLVFLLLCLSILGDSSALVSSSRLLANAKCAKSDVGAASKRLTSEAGKLTSKPRKLTTVKEGKGGKA